MKKLFSFIIILSFYQSLIALADSPNVRIFYPESYAQILKKNEGKEFTLVFWSVICSPCLKELMHIGKSKMYLNSKFVFVAVDGDDVMKDVKAFIVKTGLQSQEHWVFDRSKIDENVTTIDESWYGVVPRNYFFDDEHNRIRLRNIK